MTKMQISTHKFLAVALIILAFVSMNQATKDGVQHCNDKIRGLIENSCKTITTDYRMKQAMYQTYPSIVKRESDDEPDYRIEYPIDQSFDSLPKSHLLYNVRSKSFPSGTHLILSHHNAKVLQELNPEYKIHRQPVVYRNENGKLVKDRMNRHKRNSHKRDISHAIAGCCNNELSCLMAMCLVRHF